MNKSKGKKLIISGIVLIVAAFFLLIYNFYDSHRAERESAYVAEKIVERIDAESESVPDYIAHPEIEMPTLDIDGVKYVGFIEIPELSVVLPVAAECTAKQLKNSPCLYSGSVYLENMVIAAHNYRSHFGKIIDLPIGSRVIFTDAKGNKFNYTIEWIETLKESEKDKLISAEDCQLTLFTCTYGGEKRYAFRCIKSDD